MTNPLRDALNDPKRMEQAMKESIEDQAGQHSCQQTGEHYYASTSVPTSNNKLWVRSCMTCGTIDGKDLDNQILSLVKTEVEKVLDRLIALPNVYPEKIGKTYTHVEAIYKSALEAEKQRLNEREDKNE